MAELFGPDTFCMETYFIRHVNPVKVPGILDRRDRELLVLFLIVEVELAELVELVELVEGRISVMLAVLTDVT